jgi:hypothetical protein
MIAMGGISVFFGRMHRKNGKRPHLIDLLIFSLQIQKQRNSKLSLVQLRYLYGHLFFNIAIADLAEVDVISAVPGELNKPKTKRPWA